MIERSITTPFDIIKIKNYPSSLVIYKIIASPNWQIRYFIAGKYIRRSAGTSDKLKALDAAKALYDEVKLKERLNTALHPTTFYAAAMGFCDWQRNQVSLKLMQERTLKEDWKKLEKDILPYFRTKDISFITKTEIERYLTTLAHRSLSQSTLKKHITTIKKVLTYALDCGTLKSLPRFPRIGSDDRPRAYFPEEAWDRILSGAADLARQVEKPRYFVKGKPVRRLHFTDEFLKLLEFHFEVAIRISDIKRLQHNNVTVCQKNGRKYLRFTLKTGKTKVRTSISQPKAVEIYETLRDAHKKAGFGGANDYVFYPRMANRQYLLNEMTRLFNYLLDHTGEKFDPSGRKRTLYSIRHSVLMSELLKGRPISALARNALTSVEMIDRFYGSHLEPEMCLDQLLDA